MNIKELRNRWNVEVTHKDDRDKCCIDDCGVKGINYIAENDEYFCNKHLRQMDEDLSYWK